jgi:hypothetical protein
VVGFVVFLYGCLNGVICYVGLSVDLSSKGDCCC